MNPPVRLRLRPQVGTVEPHSRRIRSGDGDPQNNKKKKKTGHSTRGPRDCPLLLTEWKSSQAQEIPELWLDGRSNQCSTGAVISVGQIHLYTYTHKNVV